MSKYLRKVVNFKIYCLVMQERRQQERRCLERRCQERRKTMVESPHLVWALEGGGYIGLTRDRRQSERRIGERRQFDRRSKAIAA